MRVIVAIIALAVVFTIGQPVFKIAHAIITIERNR